MQGMGSSSRLFARVRRQLLWALLAVGAAAAAPALAGQTATLAIKVVVPPQAAAALSLGPAISTPDLSGPVTAAPLLQIAGLASGRYSATLVSASAAAFGTPRFTAPGSGGVAYTISLDGRPIRFEQGRAELAPGSGGRLAISTPSAVPPPLADALLLVMQAN
jgi:hypothetical protein